MADIFMYNGLTVGHRAPTQDCDRAVIVCPGLPSSSFDAKRIQALLDRNYHVFTVTYPGYPGTSGPAFLLQNPAVFVEDFIRFVRMGGVTGVLLNSIVLIGSSFGGSVVLNVKNADRVVALSPITQYRNLYAGNTDYNYETFYKYLRSNGYRINSSGWDKLKNGKLFSFAPGMPKDDLLIVYNPKDREINPTALKGYIRHRQIRSITVPSPGHVSLKNAPGRTFQELVHWIESSDPIGQYNAKAAVKLSKIISAPLRSGSALLLTGSMACGNFVAESDIDLLVITEHARVRTPRSIDGHPVEARTMSFRAFADYAGHNMRGLSRLLSSRLITGDKRLRTRFDELRIRLRAKYLGIFLAYQLMERQRMEAAKYSGTTTSLALKKGPGGRRSLGFIATTYNAIYGMGNPSFWNAMQSLVADGVFTGAQVQHVRAFFNALVKPRRNTRGIKKMLNANRNIVSAYTDDYFKKVLPKKAKDRGFIREMSVALHSGNRKLLATIARKNHTRSDAMKKHVIYYFMALNEHLPLEVCAYITARISDDRSMSNVRRNLVENPVLGRNAGLLATLAKDADPKVRFYAMKKLLNRDFLRSELVRY